MKSLSMNIKSSCQLAILPLLLSIAGCGGGGGNNPISITPADCTIDGQNEFVYGVMQDLYLYADQLPVVNPSDYSSPRALLDDLIVSPDRFSFIADQQTREDFFDEGTYNGIGFSFSNIEDIDGDYYTVTFVYDDSSAGRNGLKRGDQIVSIEGISVSQINTDGGLPYFLSNYSNEDSLTFTLRSSATETTNLEMSTGLVRINTVLKTEVITSNTLKIGYLAFTSFLEPSKIELQTAFRTLQQQNIDELVLDLRYNGGGRVDTAQILASYIAGDNAVGANAAKLLYNDKNNDLDDAFPFVSLSESVDLDRLYVLTLGGTCSASELLINAMSPVGIEVITVGQTTCGKPVGSRSLNFCDKSLVPISFNVVNDINEGDYFDGIAATCAADDDTNSLLADPNENMFATALYHIENDQCPIAARTSSKKATANRQQNPLNIMQSVY